MVLILSWNIAGLKTSAQRIVDHYGSLEAYFGRHHADIICFQEHKIAKTALSDRSIPSTILGRRSSSGSSSSSSGGGRGNNSGTATTNSKKRKIPPPPHDEEQHKLYESFWSCCTDDRYKGLNGVVTYAKVGTVRSATAAPLFCVVDNGGTNHNNNNNNRRNNNNEDWNTHGRCLMTDHGAFVLFNVYVPCGGSSSPSSSQLLTKMKFLRSLRRAMHRQRHEYGRAVILVGDLNLSTRRRDIYWKWRSVYINDILQTVNKIRCQQRQTISNVVVGGESNNNDQSVEMEDLEQWMIDVADHWPTIERSLATKTAVLTKTTNPSTGDTFTKYRVLVEIEEPTTGRRKKKVYLGSPETSPEACLGRYNLAERSYHDDELGQTVIYCEANTVEVDKLGELMAKIAGLPSWQNSSTNSRHQNNNNEALQLLRHIADSRYAGRNRVSPTGQWLQSILHDDGMVDAFAYLYPHAHGRFTCWNQNKNGRYVNEGARIDYTLLDRSLLPYLRAGYGSPLAVVENDSGGGDNTADHHNNAWTETAALQAATASGLFRPVSYHGGGMVEASRPALDTQFPNAPHTGLVYTPPTFSDHIGVSLLLDDNVFLATAATAGPANGAVTEDAAASPPPPPLELDTSDAETRRAQPHKQLKSIASFFSPRKSLADGSKQPPPQTANKQAKRVVAKVKPNRNSITFHFQKK